MNANDCYPKANMSSPNAMTSASREVESCDLVQEPYSKCGNIVVYRVSHIRGALCGLIMNRQPPDLLSIGMEQSGAELLP